MRRPDGDTPNLNGQEGRTMPILWPNQTRFGTKMRRAVGDALNSSSCPCDIGDIKA
jgi:hypothetical protein